MCRRGSQLGERHPRCESVRSVVMGLQFRHVSHVPEVDVGVFGGSGFYRFLDEVTEFVVETPWGRPSAPLAIGTFVGVRVAFLSRHGLRHELPAHRCELPGQYCGDGAGGREGTAGAIRGWFVAAGDPSGGVRSARSAGRSDLGAAGFVLRQFRRWSGACVVRGAVRRGAAGSACGCWGAEGLSVHDRGTVVVVNGPRFSTRAESAWFSAMGWDVVNMTQYPEAALACEAGLRFAGVALVTDYDAGLSGRGDVAPVTQEEVFAVFERNVERVQILLRGAITRLGAVAGAVAP